ncbi:hypothetical protein POG22_06050 [Geitlerinema sp. CS-897]|nr:hypothetical protein [Geitlerinema sp. CS-897]
MKYSFWEDFIIEGTEDYVGLWQIIGEFSLEPDENYQEIQVLTLDAIREILETGSMQVGMFENVKNKEPEHCEKELFDINKTDIHRLFFEHKKNKNLEFKIWKFDVDSIVFKIKMEWDELGRCPSIGEVAWLITTEKGEEEAKRILKEREKLKSDIQ